MSNIILIADLHLSDLRPVARQDKNWFKAMARPLEFLDNLSVDYNAPVICAGDVFDRWKASPELISFAIKYLKRFNHRFLSIAGQHDQPQHNMELLRKSAYTTLMKAGAITHLTGNEYRNIGDFKVISFSYGEDPPKEIEADIMVMHRMVWNGRPPYPGAPSEGNARLVLKEFPNVKLIVTGDNHKPFTYTEHVGQTILNCGSVMRMDADQIDYKPAAWVWDGKKLTQEYFPIDEDVLTRTHIDNEKERDNRIEEFIAKISNSKFASGLSFETNLKRWLETNHISKEIEQILYQAMENV